MDFSDVRETENKEGGSRTTREGDELGTGRWVSK